MRGLSKNNLMYNGSGYYDPTAYEAIINAEKGEHKMGIEVYRGDIFYVKKTGPVTGSEQDAGRPAVIVSNEYGNEYSTIVEVVYLTKQEKTPLPTHCTVVCKVKSTALCEQIYTVSKERLGEYVKTCTEDEMAAIDRCLMISLGLKDEPDAFEAAAHELHAEMKAKIDDLIMKLEGAERERDEVEAEYRKVLATNNSLINELEELKNQPIFPENYDPIEVTVLTTERDLYKQLYEQTLERLIAK